MPIIDLQPEILTKPIQLDLYRIAAIMLWPEPDAEATRTAYCEATGKKFLIEEMKAGRTPPLAPGDEADVADAMAWVNRSPTADTLREATERRFKWGAVVGQYLYRMIGIQHEKAWVAKDIITSRLGEFKTSLFNNEILPRMRPAAHLWAGHLFRFQETGDSRLPTTGDALGDFLAVSDWFLAQGSALTPRQAKAPLLDVADAWCPPATLRLPAANLGRLK
jgi:hypothetical protein